MRKFNSSSGVTLIEILIGIVISTVMMGAMYASYTAVNSSYSQVTDRAKINSQGRDLLGLIVRDIRNAGFKYYNDNIQTTDQHSPIIITKAKKPFKDNCDSIDIVYGGGKLNSSNIFEYSRYKITYYCEKSQLVDKSKPRNSKGKYPLLDAFAVYKTKVKWSTSKKSWENGETDNDNNTYEKQLVADYIEDLVFIPIDEKGLAISPPPSLTANKNKLYKIKTVDVSLTVRSTKPFYKTIGDKILTPNRFKAAMSDPTRTKKDWKDKIFRDTIIVTANARNIGL
tara:strand:+ start:266 stop:1114 length:849 start_codon:yes stop_codon:yes gene_type:complete